MRLLLARAMQFFSIDVKQKADKESVKIFAKFVVWGSKEHPKLSDWVVWASSA
jgi:hypothetical protein